MTEPKIIWRKRDRRSRIEFTCQDLNEVYLSFNWNGANVWEYACTAGARDGKSFAKFLRYVASLVEKTP